nr:MAG TPA: membrane protein complex protein [Caudoviricetes sp.]
MVWKFNTNRGIIEMRGTGKVLVLLISIIN